MTTAEHKSYEQKAWSLARLLPDSNEETVTARLEELERAVSDLEAAGYLERRRVGRRNHYVVHPEGPMRHPVEQGHVVGVLLDGGGRDLVDRRGSPLLILKRSLLPCFPGNQRFQTLPQCFPCHDP